MLHNSFIYIIIVQLNRLTMESLRRLISIIIKMAFSVKYAQNADTLSLVLVISKKERQKYTNKFIIAQ